MKLCKLVVQGSETRCDHCNLTWDTGDKNPPVCPSARVDTAEGLKEIIGEIQNIALRFMKRTEIIETQLNYIVATAYVNLRRQDDRGGELADWMEREIKKLNELRSGQ